MKLSEYSKYRTTRERAEAILKILEAAPGKTLHDDRGHCTDKMIKALPHHLQMQRQTNKPMNAGSFGSVLKGLEKAGWVMLEVNGKRTYNIFLVSLPDDWDEYRGVDRSHVPEPMVMPATVLPNVMQEYVPKLPDVVAEKLGKGPVTTDRLREIVREEVQAALAEWWASLS